MARPEQTNTMVNRAFTWAATRAIAGCAAIIASLSGCALSADTPLHRSTELMVSPWGPFARQCVSTRVAHDETDWRGRVRVYEVADVYTTCTGFSAMPAGADAEQITASVGNPDQVSAPVILRILRTSAGSARTARQGDSGLLAQGSDVPGAAEELASEIGLTAPQVIHPTDVLALPVRLLLPFPVDVSLSCRPDGGHVDRGRDTLVFTCTADQQVRSAQVDARIRLTGIEEIDVQTGIRLSSVLTGRLSGQTRLHPDAAWRSANDRLLYRRATDFE